VENTSLTEHRLGDCDVLLAFNFILAIVVANVVTISIGLVVLSRIGRPPFLAFSEVQLCFKGGGTVLSHVVCLPRPLFFFLLVLVIKLQREHVVQLTSFRCGYHITKRACCSTYLFSCWLLNRRDGIVFNLPLLVVVPRTAKPVLCSTGPHTVLRGATRKMGSRTKRLDSCTVLLRVLFLAFSVE
jgi:hypothetical protein